MKKAVKKVLNADAYDTMELVAEAFGGIGAGLYGYSGGVSIAAGPVCAIGQARFADVTEKPGLFGGMYLRDAGVLEAQLRSAGIEETLQDRAVRRVNRRKGKKGYAINDRITFREWAKALRVVREAA